MVRPIKIGIPFVLAAIGLHGLVGAWAISRRTVESPNADEPADFELRLGKFSRISGGDVAFDPREYLDLFRLGLDRWYSEEAVGNAVGHCWPSRTQGIDKREDLLAEIDEEGAASTWAGDYFRGTAGESGWILTLGPRGGAWSRSCSLQQGIGDGESLDVLEAPDGSLELRRVRDEPSVFRYWSVHWGARRYLIETEEFRPFVQEIRAGTEPRSSIYGNFFLRDGDERLPVEGIATITRPGH